MVTKKKYTNVEVKMMGALGFNAKTTSFFIEHSIFEKWLTACLKHSDDNVPSKNRLSIIKRVVSLNNRDIMSGLFQWNVTEEGGLFWSKLTDKFNNG